MVGKTMTIKFEAGGERSTFRIMLIDNKVDSIDVINVETGSKSSYHRWEINEKFFEKAIYLAAKQRPEIFRLIYGALKKSDPDFFGIAKKVLKKIQAEYNFS